MTREKPTYIGGELDHFNKRGYPHWNFLTTALKTGKPQSVASAGNYFSDLYSDQAVLETYTEGMTGGAWLVAPAIAAKFPWHQYRTVVDIGTSQGGLPVEIARAHPHITGGGFDLPPVRPRLRELCARSMASPSACAFTPGISCSDPLPGADVLIIGRVLHNWDLATKTMLLKKAYDALPPSGALIVYERMIDDERQSNAAGLLASLNMLIMTDGGFDYTSADLIGWMQEAGFRDLRFERLTTRTVDGLRHEMNDRSGSHPDSCAAANGLGPQGWHARLRKSSEREWRSSRKYNAVGPMTDASIHLIRIAGPADSDAVSALLLASYSSLLAARYDSDALSRALPFITSANPTLLASGTYYAAERDSGNLVGCGGWATARPGSGEIIEGEAHIHHFATHPEWVGRGIGTSLLARCFGAARQLGIRKLHCYSTFNAERFYRASGFETVGPINVTLGPSVTLPGVLMSRELP